jgi:hypothetical protein
VQKHLLLQKHFGERYPVPDAEATAYLASTPKTELGKEFADAIQTPITRSGLDLEHLRQGSFFTAEGKRRVPGTSSIDTPHELLRYMVLLEQGKLVDPFSNLKIKKLLYLTDRDPLRVVAGALRCRGLLQVGLALQLPAGAGLRLQAVPRQRAQLHELDRDRRAAHATAEPALHRGGSLERAEAQLRGRAPDARHAHPPPGRVAAPDRGRARACARGRRCARSGAYDACGKISRSSRTMSSPSQVSPAAPFASATAM